MNFTYFKIPKYYFNCINTKLLKVESMPDVYYWAALIKSLLQ